MREIVKTDGISLLKWKDSLSFSKVNQSFGETFMIFNSFQLYSFLSQDGPSATRTLDLASTLEVGSGGARSTSDADSTYNLRSVLTIAFQFTFENHLQDTVAAMARQYVRSIIGSVQRVAMAIAPSQLGPQLGVPKSLPGSPEALTLALWISRSYRFLPKHSLKCYNRSCWIQALTPWFSFYLALAKWRMSKEMHQTATQRPSPLQHVLYSLSNGLFLVGKLHEKARSYRVFFKKKRKIKHFNFEIRKHHFLDFPKSSHQNH